MSCYGALAAWYDRLTGDVDYNSFADYYEAEFDRTGGEFSLLLDLCCGTGTLSCEMARRGYELIAVDASEEMLMEAYAKGSCLEKPIMCICQRAEELDLYGTVDAAYCSLDGINYIEPSFLGEVFRRLHLFVRPGGLFIFDLRTPEFFASLDGDVFVDENDDMLCLWRADFDADEKKMIYGMDLFERRGRLWSRSAEEHIEYAHEPEKICAMLERAGFEGVKLTDKCPQGDRGRVFITAVRR